MQGFGALTPNNLCKVVETVGGGGAVVFLLPVSVSTMQDLFTFPLDAHSKLKTLAQLPIHHRFNKRLDFYYKFDIIISRN